MDRTEYVHFRFCRKFSNYKALVLDVEVFSVQINLLGEFVLMRLPQILSRFPRKAKPFLHPVQEHGQSKLAVFLSDVLRENLERSPIHGNHLAKAA